MSFPARRTLKQLFCCSDIARKAACRAKNAIRSTSYFNIYEEQKTDLFIYNDDDELNANELYMRKEELKQGLQDVLLVKVSSLKGLQEAYPSYSMDIMDFLNRVNDFLGR